MAKRDGSRHPVLRDWHLWTEVKRTVDPLRPEHRLDEPLLPPMPEPQPTATRPVWSGPALPPYRPAGVPGKPQTEPGRIIEPKMKRRLMRGQVEIDGTIDLHGMRQVEAHAALKRFISARVARGDRTVLVITGKGLKKLDDLTIVDRGVLRTMLPIWLSEPTMAPLIAGWDVSAQGHGGEGAFYVRLRRVEKALRR
jgi:DNA-nicking Smr family endonuclease